MRILLPPKLICIIFSALPVIGLFASQGAFAACGAKAGVLQTTQLQWPVLGVPAGSANYTVSGATGTGSGTGTAIYGTSTRGQYNVKKTSGNENQCSTISIDITNIVPGNANLTLGSFTGNYNGTNLVGPPPWTGLAMPGAGKTLFLGATSSYNASIPIGALTPTFNVAVHYDTRADELNAHTGSIAFDSPLSIGSVANINFGMAKAATTGIYTINTDNVISVSGSGEILAGTPASGSMVIFGSATQTITISTGMYTAGGRW